MPQSRPSLLMWLLGASALLWMSLDSLPAQDDAPKKESPKVEEEKPTPWPPPNTEKHEIKRDDQPQGLILYTPKTWKKGKPTSTLRLAEFSIPPAEGDKEPVELTIFSFREGAGGGIPANVERWINQFQQKDRKSKVVSGEGHQGVYVLVDVEGTYNMPDGPPILQKTKAVPNARMLAAIIGIRWEEKQAADGEEKPVKKAAVYFLKMAGPEKTVTANEEAFRQAFGATNRSKENPINVKEEPAEPPSN